MPKFNDYCPATVPKLNLHSMESRMLDMSINEIQADDTMMLTKMKNMCGPVIRSETKRSGCHKK